MTIALAAVPLSIDVTPDVLVVEILVIAGLSFPPGATTTLDLSTAANGRKSDIYLALHDAEAKGVLACDPVTQVLSDPVASGQSPSRGQDVMGTIAVDA